MTKQEFIAELQEELEFDETLTLDSNLKDLDEWDSMAAMVLIGFVGDNFDKTLTADDLKEMTSIESLIEKIGQDHFTQ